MYGNRLKEVRDTLRYTVDELAEIIGFKKRTLGSYERNEATPSVELVTALCNKLNVNANWFVSGKGEMFIKEQPADFKSTVKQAIQELIREGELHKDDFV